MTKNLVELSHLVLERFRGSDGQPVRGRLVSPNDLPSEIESLKNVERLSAWDSSTGRRILEFRYGGAYCVAVTFGISDAGKETIATITDDRLSVIEIPGSVYLYLAWALKLQPTRNEAEWVEQYIAGPATTEGVDLDTIKASLEDITVFSVSDISMFRVTVPGTYIPNYLCTFDPMLEVHTQLTDRSICIIREMFLHEKESLIERNIFQAMATPIAKHAFLEIYRLLEFVFVLPRTRALLECLKLAGGTLDMRLLDFARHCNQQLGWKRVERDSLERLFKEYAISNYSAFRCVVERCKPFSGLTVPEGTSIPEERTAFVSRFVEIYYQLRNQVAHQLWPDEERDCSDIDWQHLSEFTLDCIAFLYRQHLSKEVTMLVGAF